VIADLRADRVAWREQAQRLALPALADSGNAPLPAALVRRRGGLQGARSLHASASQAFRTTEVAPRLPRCLRQGHPMCSLSEVKPGKP
jgi:hypothetical protein